MKKNLLTLTLIFGIFASFPAKADFEGIQTVFTVIENITKKVDNVYGKVIDVTEKIKALRSGQFGPIDINKIKGIADKAKETLTGGSLKEKIQARFKKGDILKGLESNDGKTIEEGIINETVPKYTDKEQTETFLATEDANSIVLRENLSRLYAYAFTLRTNLAKEREENDDTPLTTTDSREILALANKEALESARRFNRILDMQSSKTAIEILLLLKYSSQEEDKEE